LAIFLQQLMTTRAYYMRPRLLIALVHEAYVVQMRICSW